MKKFKLGQKVWIVRTETFKIEAYFVEKITTNTVGTHVEYWTYDYTKPITTTAYTFTSKLNVMGHETTTHKDITNVVNVFKTEKQAIAYRKQILNKNF